MSITVTPEYDPESWNALVDRSDGTSPVHRYEFLRVLERYAGGRLHPLVAYNGEEPVGLFPVFETQAGPFTTVSSPPAMLDTLPLGPATLGTEGMKRRRVERVTRRFVEESLAWMESRLDPDQIRVRTDPRFGDLRPFLWEGFDARPYYTYVVDVDRDEEELLGEFSRDARRNVRDADDVDYAIEVGGREDLETIVEQVLARHREMGEPLGIPAEFFLDVHDALPDDVLRPYVCRVDGEYTSGVAALEHGDVVYRWKGGAKTDADLASSDVLDWHVMRETRDRGGRLYDLVGANVPRLCDYKAKFGPEPRTYYFLERQSPRLAAAVAARRLARRGTTAIRDALDGQLGRGGGAGTNG